MLELSDWPERRTQELNPLLTVKRAAYLASVSEATIRRAIREGRLPSVRIGRSVRIRPDDFDAFQASSRG